MKIALVYPPCAERKLKGYPLGIAYLSASLKRAHEVGVFNYNGKDFQSSLRDFFKAAVYMKPDVLGVSFNSFNRWGAYHILRNIKKFSKNTIVVLGGVHPSTLYNQIFDYFYDCVDFIIQSEGEISFYELCGALEKRTDYKDISGLVYKSGKRSFTANFVSRVVEDLDELPMPDFSYAAHEIKKKETAYLITSRGCPVNCTFCSTSSFWGQKVRMYSPVRVAREVEYVKSMGAKRLFFHDDTFNLGIERTEKIADILKEMRVEYVIQCRVKPVNETMIQKLAGSGCKHISWGVESLSDTILKKINKKITKEEVKRAFDICSGYTDKFTTSAYCCVGIPGETEDTINETVDYFNKYIKSTHGPQASMLYVLPGTELYHELVKKGRFRESLWVKSDAVYYYTQEHNIKVLNRWRKKVNRSGIRIPFSVKYFWDCVSNDDNEEESQAGRKFNKLRKKVKRYFNLVRNRY